MLPTVLEYKVWVNYALWRLNMPKSAFLRYDKAPGSVNRVRNILNKYSSINLSMARKLEEEILAEAKKLDIEIVPLSECHKNSEFWPLIFHKHVEGGNADELPCQVAVNAK